MGIQMTTKKSPRIFVLGRWDWDPICLKFECFFPNAGRLTCQFFFLRDKKRDRKGPESSDMWFERYSYFKRMCLWLQRTDLCILCFIYFLGDTKHVRQCQYVVGLLSKKKEHVRNFLLDPVGRGTPMESLEIILDTAKNLWIGWFKTIFWLSYMVNHR